MTTPAQQDKRIPWYFVGFFVFIATINAIMITLATTTYTGTVTDHPYEKGLAYNRIVEASDAQQQLGWHATMNLRNDELVVALYDAKGNLLAPDRMVARFTRPAQAGMDFELPLDNGRATVHFPAKGVWDLRLLAAVGTHRYQQSQRVVVE